MSRGQISAQPAVVLLVEDDSDHAELVRRSLENYSAKSRLYHVTDGEAALQYLFRRGHYSDASRSPRPRIVLLDLRLPKISGLEVLRRVKEDEGLRRIPVVVFSTSGAATDVKEAYDNCSNGYLIKPCDFDELTEMICSFCSYWLNWNYYPW